MTPCAASRSKRALTPQGLFPTCRMRYAPPCLRLSSPNSWTTPLPALIGNPFSATARGAGRPRNHHSLGPIQLPRCIPEYAHQLHLSRIVPEICRLHLPT
jgi:hypothetical protein